MKKELLQRICFFTMLAGTVVACKDSEQEDLSASVDIRVTAQAEPLQIEGATGTDKIDILWEKGDSLSVWALCQAGNSGNSKFTLDPSTAGTPQGLFRGMVSTPNYQQPQRLFAVYPYSETRGNDITYISMKIPATQTQNGSDPQLKQKGVFIGKADINNLNTEEAVFNLDYSCAGLQFSLDCKGTELENKQLASITLTADIPFIGNMVYDLKNDQVVVTSAGKTGTLQFADSPQLSSEVKGWMAIKPTDLSQSALQIEVRTTDQWTAEIEYTPSSTYEVDKIYPINLNIKELTDEGQATINEPVTDLSSSGTANCYIVTTQAKYKFKATKGNSNESPGDINKVDWLWMSKADLIHSISYDDGAIIFKATGEKGNVLLAAFDASGNILWSWHIWITDDPRTNTHYVASNRYVLLDRHLGATTADADNVSSYGLLYQWGRKDPFIGALNDGNYTAAGYRESAGFTTATAEYVKNPTYNKAFQVVNNTDVSVDPELFEIPYTVQNPMNYIQYSSNSNDSGTSWFNSPCDTDFHKDLWGGKATNSYRKTIYDPCPPGYKVPNFTGDTWTGLAWDNTLSKESYLYIAKYTSADQTGYYPASGSRPGTRNGRLADTGTKSVLWGSLWYMNGTNLTGRTMTIDFLNKSVNTNSKTNVCDAASVRCQKE